MATRHRSLDTMRVLHVIPAIATRYGGPSAAVIGMCQSLRAAGINAVIVTTDADGTGRLPVEIGTLGRFRDVPTIFFRRQATESFKWSIALASWLKAHVSEFDLVHVHAVFSHSSIAAGRACRAAGVPYIIRPLGTLDPWSLDRHPRRKQLLLALGGRRFLAGAHGIHYTTVAERQLAEQRLPWLPAGCVVPLGIDEEFFASSDSARPRETPILVSMCRLHPKKRLELLIDAFHRVTASGPFTSWRLDIVGDGDADYVRRLQEAAAAGPAAARIEFRGWLSGEARRDLLAASTLFALPSNQENFGLALVEGMAMGLPAIVTPGVNLADDILAAKAGWVCEGTIASLSDALRIAMTNQDMLENHGRCARDLAGRFRWSSVADGLRTLYEQTLRGPVSTPNDVPVAAPS